MAIILGILWLQRTRLPLALDLAQPPPSPVDPLFAGAPLARPPGIHGPLHGEVVERYGGRRDGDLDDSVTADPEQQHPLAGTAREAASNAVRHGAADRVRVTLRRGGRRRELLIHDNGAGVEVTELPAAVMDSG
jgi:hypothetical protein